MKFAVDFRYPLLCLRARFQGFEIHETPYDMTLVRGTQSIRINLEQKDSLSEVLKNFDALFSMLVPRFNGEKEWLDFSHLYVHTHCDSGSNFELVRCCTETDQDFDIYFREYRPTREDLVFDLGADCGLFTHQISRMSRHVISFDPDAVSSDIISRNVARNKLTNVTVADNKIRLFEDLVALKGVPAFCRVNLDRVRPDFVLSAGDILFASSITFAARSNSAKIRLEFCKGLREFNYESAIEKTLGAVWSWPVIG